MSTIDSFPSATESFQRLEDFPTFTSCIRCFGKSIISPLLTTEQREEVCRFRTAAAKIEADNVRKKKECSSIPEKEHPVSCSNNDFALQSENEERNSALHAEQMLHCQTCLTSDATIFSNEMHISLCKVPSSDVCSTVHENVIVPPHVIETNNDKEESFVTHAKCPTSCTDLDNDDCASCLGSNQPDLTSWIQTIPYENATTKQTYSVSEDDHDSITDSTDFGSLPTVINAKQLVSQDTDNESNTTCLTQSTDLEKYLDSSIDYSSPDDLALSRSQISNNLNASSRSDDASSETLVNTGSESTPCASAMAILGYVEDARSDIVPKKNHSEVNNLNVPQRPHSVDSYVKMVEACADKSPIRKSQSEPSYTESKHYSEVSLPSAESDPPDLTLNIQVPKMKAEIDDLQQEEITPVSDSEVFMDFESMTEAKKSLKRKHLRTNSYTLEHPSPALILAHADCNCSEDSPNLSPHSCSSDKISHSPPNLAFKKEKVNIVLPPTSEREKYFPILSSASVSMKKPDVCALGDSKISVSGVTVETEVQLPEAAFVNSNQEENGSESIEDSKQVKESITNSNAVNKKAENSSKESFEESSNVSTQAVNQPKEQITVSSVKPSEEKSNIKEFFNQVIHDMKEIQKNRVNQFFEEQNKLWLQMQEEFKEQEILLCEKLKAVEMLSSSDGADPMPYEYSDGDIQQPALIEQNILSTNTNSVLHSSGNSNTRNDCLSAEPSEVDVSEKFLSPKPFSDITNFEVAESPNEIIHKSQSTTSTANTSEESEIPPMLANYSSSLSATDGSQQADSYDGYQTRSHSLQASVSSKSMSNTDIRFQTRTLDNLSDKPESLYSNMSESSVDKNLKAFESHSLLSSLSSKSFSNSGRNEGCYSSASETSVDNNLKPSKPYNLQSGVSSKSLSNSDRMVGCYSSTSETSIDNNIKPYNLQSGVSSKSFSNPSRLESYSSRSETSVDNNLKASKSHNFKSDVCSKVFSNSTSLDNNSKFSESQNLQSSMSSESLSNPGRLEGRYSSTSETSVDNNFKASEVSAGSNIQRDIPMQSLYDGCPISALSVPYCLESNSSVSYRSSSDLSDVFRDSRFLKENNCPACSSASSGKVCACQEHREGGGICPECNSCLKCYSFERRHISYEALSDGGNRHFTTPISPSEFIPHPPFLMKDKNSTSLSLNSLPVQNHGFNTTTLSLKNNNNISSLDLNSSDETSHSGQHPLLSNNLELNMKQNMLIINAKNILSDLNTPDDKSYSEEEIRAISDLVQSSYTSSYSCPLNENCSIISNNSNKNPNQMQGCKILYQVPSVEKGALKQSISTSLTNLKRRQSRDISKDPILLKKFEKLPALVKGYLTRRLFKTERVQDLIRTLKDTALLVGKFSQELESKGNSVSENDVDFHRQLIAQLLKTFESVYDIFCTMSIKEQMKIISESRNFRKKKKITAKNEFSASVIAEKCRSSPSKKPRVSAATLKALERKRSAINSRTYAVEDFKTRKPRIHSMTTTKSCATSPSRIYKSTVGTALKRKTTSVCKTSPWK